MCGINIPVHFVCSFVHLMIKKATRLKRDRVTKDPWHNSPANIAQSTTYFLGCDWIVDKLLLSSLPNA